MIKNIDMKQINPEIIEIASDIRKKYGCHTVILYGSHARGEATEKSDIDLIAIREKGDFDRDCRPIGDQWMDLFIYPENKIINPDVSMIRIRDGIVILQKEHMGDKLLEIIRAIFEKGPPETPGWEIHEIENWLMKMLGRASIPDREGNFRRHWLLHDMLECYFKLRNLWYMGPKESFKWLEKHDPYILNAFDRALDPMASLAAIEQLIQLIVKIKT